MLDAQDRDIRDMPDEEQWAIGKAMYERDILPRLTDADSGMYVVMDMLSGDCESEGGERFGHARYALSRFAGPLAQCGLLARGSASLRFCDIPTI